MRVLVVEDEALIAMCLVTELEESGHEVVGFATSLEQAKELAEKAHPAIALVDIDLQRPAEGVEVATVLKSDYNVPAMFVTGQIDVARQHADVAVGAIKKPFHIEDILQGLGELERCGGGQQLIQSAHIGAVEWFSPATQTL